jgi:hypothetical protein
LASWVRPDSSSLPISRRAAVTVFVMVGSLQNQLQKKRA